MSQLVFMSSDAARLSARWSEHRVGLLGRAISVDATNHRKVDPMLLAVVVGATLSPNRVARCMSRPPVRAVLSRQAGHYRWLEGATLVKLGQHHVRVYLSFFFAEELTKLLSNRNSCLKGHSKGVELQMRWRRATSLGAASG